MNGCVLTLTNGLIRFFLSSRFRIRGAPSYMHPNVFRSRRSPSSLCWFSAVAGVTGLIRCICAVKTVKIVVFFSVFTGGAPLSLYHIRGKKGKNQKFYVFTVFPGEGTPFSSTISAVKTVKIDLFFPVFTAGALLFLLPYPR